jgi:hypothetical protein
MSDFADLFNPRHGGVTETFIHGGISEDPRTGMAYWDGGSRKLSQTEINKLTQLNQQKNFTPATTSPEMALQPPSMLPMILSVGLAMFFIYCNKKN